MTTAVETTRLTAGQIREAGDVLGRAFWDDPLIVYLLPDEATRRRALPWFFTKAALYGHRYGEVHTTAAAVEGSAIWLPPGATKITLRRMAATGMLFAPFRLGMGPFMRFMRAMNYVEHLHDRDMPNPHWYLFVLGVDPPRQGQGVGGALIAPMLARADAERLPCYLETMKPRNVPFYQKHGFEVVVEDDLPKGAPHFWTMKRQPR